MHDTILVPTDGSAQARFAVEEAVEMAAAMDATVHALYVMDQFESRIVPITGEQEQKRAEYREYGEDVTGEVAEMAENAGVECVTTVADGIAHEKIVDYAEDNDVDMVVMGSRGLSNVEEMLLGSTADKVIRALDVPVTVVHKEPSETLDWMIRGQDTVHV